MMKTRAALFVFSMIALGAPNFGSAEDTQTLGRVTGFPVPRYVSMSREEANMRRGPSEEYPIDWIYHQDHYPFRVIGESGHWRKVEDVEGVRGWIHYRLLSGTRYALITADRVNMHQDAAENAQLTAILEKGVLGKLLACTQNWCQLEVQKIDGWVPKSTIWGADPNEVFEE